MIPYFKYLKKALYAHILMGILVGLSASFFLISNNYLKATDKLLQLIEKSLNTASQVREEQEILQKKIGTLKAYLPSGKDVEFLIVERLDLLKKEFPSYKITVTEFQTSDNVLSIGFTAQGSIDYYREFVKRINLLEALVLPSLRVNKLMITVDQQGNNMVQFSGTIKMINLPFLKPPQPQSTGVHTSGRDNIRGCVGPEGIPKKSSMFG